MTRAKLLHQNEGHARAENTDFIKRLRFKKDDEVALKSDCINLAIQYVAVYQALEFRLAQLCTDSIHYVAVNQGEYRLEQLCPEPVSYLAVFTQEPWTERSVHLEKDVAEMKSFLPPEEQQCLINDNYLFPATRNMIGSIQQANTVELFSWLMVRCLGDAFGGQAIKGYTQQIFGNNQLTACFANGISSQATTLCKIVNQAELSEDEEKLFYSTADTVFQLHVELFEEMEGKRVLPEIKAAQQIAQSEQQEQIIQKRKPAHATYSTGCKFLMFATLATSAAIAIGSTYCSVSGPQK